MNTAQQISSLLHDDGTVFDSNDGRSLTDLVAEYHGTTKFTIRHRDDDGEIAYSEGAQSSYFSGDPIRHEFSDGSAIVEIGGAWDFADKSDPFGWNG